MGVCMFFGIIIFQLIKLFSFKRETTKKLNNFHDLTDKKIVELRKMINELKIE